MESPVEREDWEALMGVLGEGIGLMDGKETEPVKQAILQFVSTAAMLGLQDLADVSKRFETFLLEKVAPGWSAEASATLSFTMGALVEKMQLNEYGPKFSEGLKEILIYLDFYAEEEPLPAPTPNPVMEAPVDAAIPASPQVKGRAVEAGDILSEAEVEDLFSDADLLSDIELQPPKGDLLADISALGEDFLSDEPAPSTAVPAETDSLPLEKVFTPEADTPPASACPPRRDMGFVMDRVDWFRQILRNDPTSQAFVSLAEEYCTRGQWKKAVETCRKGLALHPYLLRGRILLGWALWGMGKKGEAERTLAEARVELEGNGILYKILSDIAESRGDKKEAQELMATYERFSPSLARGLISRMPVSPADDSPQGELSPLIELLTALMDRFKAPPAAARREYKLFGDEDREALRLILSGIH